MPRGGQAGSTPIRRSRRTTRGVSPARLGTNDGWAESSAGEWDTKNAADVLEATSAAPTPSKRRASARKAKTVPPKAASATPSKSKTKAKAATAADDEAGAATTAAQEKAIADAALPCGQYSDCTPGPITYAFFFNCAIVYLVVTLNAEAKIVHPYVEVALKAVPLLALLLWSLTEDKLKVPRGLLSGALFFSLVGDVVLESDVLGIDGVVELDVAGKKLGFFELGAAAFGVAHVFYCVLLLRGPFLTASTFFGFGVIAIFFKLISDPILAMCVEKNPELEEIVTVYIGLLVALVACALVGTKHAPSALLGAAIFCASDALLAVNKFSDEPLAYPTLMVMVPYWTAQYLLVTGISNGAPGTH